MGVTKITWDSFQEVISERKRALFTLKSCELGNQQFFFKEPHIVEGIKLNFVKNFYDLGGSSHTSIDINGQDGALSLDFSKEIPFTLKGVYDILTNFGFTEHVESQYIAWKNIHDLIKVGGIVICENPGESKFEYHQHLPWYGTEFFEGLCKINEYKLLKNRYQQHDYPCKGRVIFAAYEKAMDKEFCTEEEFNKLQINKNI